VQLDKEKLKTEPIKDEAACHLPKISTESTQAEFEAHRLISLVVMLNRVNSFGKVHHRIFNGNTGIVLLVLVPQRHKIPY
jgi:hypothetical protein